MTTGREQLNHGLEQTGGDLPVDLVLAAGCSVPARNS